MLKKLIKITVILRIFILLSPKVYSQLFADFETGMAFCGYNTVQIPRDTGTKFSLSDDLSIDSSPFFRIRVGFRIKDKHNLYFLVAPFSLKAEGAVDKVIKYNEEDFPANIPLEAEYKFNSYRITYRYDLLKNENWKMGLGFTAKIRDASISMKGSNKYTEKTNAGFVPLFNFWIERYINNRFSLILEGDALAAPQGRAEDILIAALYKINKNVVLTRRVQNSRRWCRC